MQILSTHKTASSQSRGPANSWSEENLVNIQEVGFAEGDDEIAIHGYLYDLNRLTHSAL